MTVSWASCSASSRPSRAATSWEIGGPGRMLRRISARRSMSISTTALPAAAYPRAPDGLVATAVTGAGMAIRATTLSLDSSAIGSSAALPAINSTRADAGPAQTNTPMIIPTRMDAA